MANPTVHQYAEVARRNDQAAIEALADRVALAVSDPTRSSADPGALDRPPTLGHLSLCRLPRTVCAPSALRRSVGLRSTPLALRRLIAVIPRALGSLVGARLTPGARRLSVN